MGLEFSVCSTNHMILENTSSFSVLYLTMASMDVLQLQTNRS